MSSEKQQMLDGLISLGIAISKKWKHLLSTAFIQAFPGCSPVQQALIVSTEDIFKLKQKYYSKLLILTHYDAL